MSSPLQKELQADTKPNIGASDDTAAPSPAQTYGNFVPVAGLVFGPVSPASHPETSAAPDADRPGVASSAMKSPGKPLTQAELKTRRNHFATLLEEDKEALRKDWAVPDSVLFDAALHSEASFNFFKGLTAGQRVLVQVADIQAAIALDNSQWSQHKWDHTKKWTGFTAEDRIYLATQWNMMPVDSEPFVTASDNRENYKFVKGLDLDHRSVVLPEEIRKKKNVVQEVYRERRRKDVTKLTPNDRAEISVDWGIPENSPCFLAATSTQVCYEFTSSLPPENRRAATEAVIKSCQKIPAKQWTQLRCEHTYTMTEADRAAIIEEWAPVGAIFENHAQRALSDDDFYQYFRALDDDQRKYLTKRQFTDKATPKASEIHQQKIAAEKAAKIASSRQPRAPKASAPSVNDPRIAANIELWKSFEKGFHLSVDERVEAGLLSPNHDWGAAINGVLAPFAELVVKGENPKNVAKKAKPEVELHVAHEAKRAFIEQDEPRFRSGKLRNLQDIINTVMKDEKLKHQDFLDRANAALLKQCSPDKKAWMGGMGLVAYTPGRCMTKLTPIDGLKAHITIEENWLTLPNPLKLDTKVDDLLNQLFTLEKVHVTLETMVRNAADEFTQPHRYWRACGAQGVYGLILDDGTPRWDPHSHTQADIEKALDMAYEEMLGRFRERAKKIIDERGIPDSPRPNR